MRRDYKTNCSKCKKVFYPQDEGTYKQIGLFELYYYCGDCSEKVKVIDDQANVSGSLLETRNCLICGYFCNNEHHSNNWYDTKKQ